MDLSDLYTDVIKDHAAAPHNKHHLHEPDLIMPGSNPTCGDEITLEMEVKDGVIAEAAFMGTGCAISQTSVSIMTDLIKGKTLQEARKLGTFFLAMSRRETISEEELDALEEAAALQNVSNMPARIKCATMPWHTLMKALDQIEVE